MSINQSNKLAAPVAFTSERKPSTYQPAGDEHDQLDLQLRELCGKMLSYCSGSNGMDELARLNELSHELDEISARLRMHMRTLTAGQRLSCR